MSLNIVGGVFSKEEEAAKSIQELQELGFTKEDISIFAQDSDQADRLEEDANVDITTNTEDRGSNSGKGLGYGALSGGILGGIGGLIAGAAAITIPGVGPIVAAGPLATTLAGVGTGAVGGGVVGALVGAGLPEEQAKEYEEFIKEGNIVVLLKVDEDQKENVENTFRNSGSINTSMYKEQ